MGYIIDYIMYRMWHLNGNTKSKNKNFQDEINLSKGEYLIRMEHISSLITFSRELIFLRIDPISRIRIN